MSNPFVSLSIEILRKRALGEGGFGNTDNSNYRTDATAWAILALIAHGNDQELINLSRSRLAASQLSDGRVCIDPHPEAYWPTPLAILAWHQSPAHQSMVSHAAQFLLNNSGSYWQAKPGQPEGHDTSLKGWPWVAATHSWVDPTALGIIALKATGYGDHPRVSEAKRLILDRECLHGGWNYGNRLMFGAELRPMPETTGMALNALKDLPSKSSLEPSLNYLKSLVKNLRTPIALAWSLLGLGAWGERPAAAPAWLFECWKRQEWYGVYDTTSLSLLVLAFRSPGGLESIFSLDQALPRG